MEYILFFIIKTVVLVWVIRFGLEWLSANGYLADRRRTLRDQQELRPNEREVEVRTYDVNPPIGGYLPMTHPRDRDTLYKEFEEFQQFKKMRRY